MMKDFAIKTEELSKEYHIYDSPAERLKELFLTTKKHRVFRAFGPLDIVIPKGETLGIVGENGAGKSTFLKLIAGVIEPSSGSLAVNGKISSILELGTGFNPEFTGRENVVLNGALLGLSSPGDNQENGQDKAICGYRRIFRYACEDIFFRNVSETGIFPCCAC